MIGPNSLRVLERIAEISMDDWVYRDQLIDRVDGLSYAQRLHERDPAVWRVARGLAALERCGLIEAASVAESMQHVRKYGFRTTRLDSTSSLDLALWRLTDAGRKFIRRAVEIIPEIASGAARSPEHERTDRQHEPVLDPDDHR